MPVVSESLTRAMRHHQAGEFSRAEDLYREVLRTEPNHPDALHFLGLLARQTGRAELAIESIAKAVAINTTNPAFYYNLARALHERGRLDQAISHYQKALELDPKSAEGHLKLAAALEQQGRLTEALASYNRGLALKPHDTDTRLLRGLVSLKLGEFEEGWREYEWRWRRREGTPLRSLHQPFWDGEPLAGKTILVHAEDSLADQVMFASCLPDLITQAGHTMLMCDPRLERLFRHSFPTATVHAPSGPANRWPAQVESVDVRIPGGSVPRYLRPNLESFPSRRRYLRPDRPLAVLWKTRVDALGPGMKIGIVWHGGGNTPLARQRSTPLELWYPLLSLPGTRFVSLQTACCREALAEARRHTGVEVHSFGEFIQPKDLDQQAALLTALDLVISVPNLTAHLAGSLGVEVWNLLTCHSSWRWLLDREDSPWYASMKLIRQTQPDDWSDVFDRLARLLGDRLQMPETIG